MQLVWSIDDLNLRDVWLTIGSFDGVHKGHQALLGQLTAGARRDSVPAVALTFHPHPAVVLGKRPDFTYLTSPEERAALLGEHGVDVVIVHPFSRQVAELEASEFIARLHAHLHMQRLCVGHDFALGRGRKGDIHTLEQLGREFGYRLDLVPVMQLDGEVVSSSQVRLALSAGDVGRASLLLGRPYRVDGEVVRGDGRGRTIGIPTANLAVWAGRLLPKPGVYACTARLDGEDWNAVTNIGYRPTFEGQPPFPQVEAHLLDFDRDLYNQRLSLAFVARLREEQRFPGVAALVEQIHRDIGRAREILNSSSGSKEVK